MICNIPVDQNSVFAPTLDGLSSSWNSLEYNFVKKEKKKKKKNLSTHSVRRGVTCRVRVKFQMVLQCEFREVYIVHFIFTRMILLSLWPSRRSSVSGLGALSSSFTSIILIGLSD